MGVLQQIWLYEILGGMLLICQNTTMRVYGAWIRKYYALCYKKNGTFSCLFCSAAGSRLTARGARICDICLVHNYANYCCMLLLTAVAATTTKSILSMFYTMEYLLQNNIFHETFPR